MDTKQSYDTITLEVLRTRLQAMAEEGALTIERAACSPTISEARDCSCAILDADGDLIVGGGAINYHFAASSHAVRCTIARHGGTIAPGDVFIANDPHDGGGLHYQDVVVQRPIFHSGRLIAWVANSGHMIDVGGMAFGSWSPQATECYQEALRLPPVRLFRQGEEQADVWAVIRNNVRVSHLVELDIRGIVAGCQVVHDKLLALVGQWGADKFIGAIAALRDAFSKALRQRVGRLEDGTYSLRTWTEWNDERYVVPCALTIEGERMVVDFAGAAQQCQHFFNSKPHIIASLVVSDLSDVLATDMPLSAAMFDQIEVRCPAGTIVNAAMPAPMASSHFDVALNASMAAQQCLMLAVAASGEGAPGQRLLSGPGASSALGLHTWAYETKSGHRDGWFMIDGGLTGGSGGHDRDGYDLGSFMVARTPRFESVDTETFEGRYPVLVLHKRARQGVGGAGSFRSGGGCEQAYTPHNVEAWRGVMLGMRERLPLLGFAGGRPGAVVRLQVVRADGCTELVGAHDDGVVVRSGDVFSFSLGSGGGYGDPVDREAEAVARDVRQSRINEAEAEAAYGVVLDAGGEVDSAASVRRREKLLGDRLRRARPPRKSIDRPLLAAPMRGNGRPLYPGVENHGGVAYAVDSGRALALSPGAWTDGCATIDEEQENGVILRSYLDPGSGRTMMVDAAVDADQFCTISSRPRHWTSSGVEGQRQRGPAAA